MSPKAALSSIAASPVGSAVVRPAFPALRDARIGYPDDHALFDQCGAGGRQTRHDLPQWLVAYVADRHPLAEHARPHRAIRGDRSGPVCAPTAQLGGTGLGVPDSSADLPQTVITNLLHAERRQFVGGLLGTLPVAKINHPGPQRDTTAHRFDNVGLRAGIAGSTGDSGMLPWVVAVIASGQD